MRDQIIMSAAAFMLVPRSGSVFTDAAIDHSGKDLHSATEVQVFAALPLRFLPLRSGTFRPPGWSLIP